MATINLFLTSLRDEFGEQKAGRKVELFGGGVLVGQLLEK